MIRSSRPKSKAAKTPSRPRRRRDPVDVEIDRRIANGEEAETFLCLDCHCWHLDPAFCACWTRAVFVVE